MIIIYIVSFFIFGCLVWFNVLPRRLFFVSLGLILAAYLFLSFGNKDTADLLATVFFVINVLNIAYDLLRPAITKLREKLSE